MLTLLCGLRSGAGDQQEEGAVKGLTWALLIASLVGVCCSLSGHVLHPFQDCEKSMRIMLRLSRATALLLALTFVTERAAFATSSPDAASAKQQIAARGVGKGVKVHEADGTVLRGKIVSMGEDSFGMQVGSKPVVEVPFANVREVQGPGLSKGAKIAIWTGVGVLVLVIAVGASYAHAANGILGSG